jgi:hypothetical protein
MSLYVDRHERKPTTPDEFIRCIIWSGWDRRVSFMQGCKLLLGLKPDLIRESIRLLEQRPDLTSYTHALTKLVDLSTDDGVLLASWKTNLPHLRALLVTSPRGTALQRSKLLEISQNRQVVDALRFALQQNVDPIGRDVEPAWIAVLYAEGSEESVREADRFNRLCNPDTRTQMLTYRTSVAGSDADLHRLG